MLRFTTSLPLLILFPWDLGVFEYLFSGNRFNSRTAENATFHYVVGGGGTSGLTVAARLTERRHKVAVVKAGGYYEYVYPMARVPGSCSLGASADIQTMTPIDWGFVVRGVPGTNFRDVYYPRGKFLGGS
ncbi:hypothetical protein PENVUL_c063G02579 [Penicillium vulpinum]|uniref:Uncharacterized protein n=1 Tax=Penicillium vulpinum TaxID=29845 RepID=A0A1V6RDP0_9EURO|nr:hypothetical protein PENVUL_c063G02579 [Penicillium vulpinum]